MSHFGLKKGGLQQNNGIGVRGTFIKFLNIPSMSRNEQGISEGEKNPYGLETDFSAGGGMRCILTKQGQVNIYGGWDMDKCRGSQ